MLTRFALALSVLLLALAPRLAISADAGVDAGDDAGPDAGDGGWVEIGGSADTGCGCAAVGCTRGERFTLRALGAILF
jgi:hypothetical protein